MSRRPQQRDDLVFWFLSHRLLTVVLDDVTPSIWLRTLRGTGVGLSRSTVDAVFVLEVVVGKLGSPGVALQRASTQRQCPSPLLRNFRSSPGSTPRTASIGRAASDIGAGVCLAPVSCELVPPEGASREGGAPANKALERSAVNGHIRHGACGEIGQPHQARCTTTHAGTMQHGLAPSQSLRAACCLSSGAQQRGRGGRRACRELNTTYSTIPKYSRTRTSLLVLSEVKHDAEAAQH